MEKPYYLSDAKIQWVEDTIASMTNDTDLGDVYIEH